MGKSICVFLDKQTNHAALFKASKVMGFKIRVNKNELIEDES
jgi:hypothetical protein